MQPLRAALVPAIILNVFCDECSNETERTQNLHLSNTKSF